MATGYKCENVPNETEMETAVREKNEQGGKTKDNNLDTLKDKSPAPPTNGPDPIQGSDNSGQLLRTVALKETYGVLSASVSSHAVYHGEVGRPVSKHEVGVLSVTPNQDPFPRLENNLPKNVSHQSTEEQSQPTRYQAILDSGDAASHDSQGMFAQGLTNVFCGDSAEAASRALQKHMHGASAYASEESTRDFGESVRARGPLQPPWSEMERSLGYRVMDEDGAVDLQLARIRRLWSSCCVSCKEEKPEVKVCPCGHWVFCGRCFLDNYLNWQHGSFCPVCICPSNGVAFTPDMLNVIIQRTNNFFLSS